MARAHSETDLISIYRQLSGVPTLLVPPASTPRVSRGPGAVFQVPVTYLEFTGREDAAAEFWALLQQLPVEGTVAILTGITNTLAMGGAVDPDVQCELEDRFASPELRTHIRGIVRRGPATSVLFNRLAALFAMSHVIAHGNGALPNLADTPKNFHKIGKLFLFANQFLDPDPSVQGPLSDADLMSIMIPTWDLLNRRDLAYTMTRTYSVLAEALNGTTSDMTELRTRVFGAAPPIVDGLSVEDFRAIVFGIFSWAGNLRKQSPRLVFDRRELLRNFPTGQSALDVFAAARSRTVSEFRALLGAATGFDEFEHDLHSDRFLAGRVIFFRQYPLLRLDADRFALLDLTFFTELLSQGIYWTIFDALPSDRRNDFKKLWGLAFEQYACDLMEYFYPPASQLLRPRLPFAGGQVDAFLDFGSYVVMMEIKSSLLTEVAKRSGQREVLLADIDRKFVRNERGKKKGVTQLTAACNAIRSGKLLAIDPKSTIFPVLVTDEVCAEAPGFNAYLHSKFATQLANATNVKPLTVLSIGELEELMPYVSAGRFDFPRIFSAHVSATGGVEPASIHATLLSLPQRGSVIRNDFIESRFASIRDHVNALFGVSKK